MKIGAFRSCLVNIFDAVVLLETPGSFGMGVRL